MDRSLRRLAVALSAATLIALASVSGVAAGKPTPPPPPRPYATLSIDKNCNISLVAAWTDPTVTQVYAQNWIDVTTYLFTEAAPGNGTFDAATMTASWLAGPLVKSRTVHAFHTQVDFYDAAGANLGLVYADTTAKCAVA